MGTYVAHRSAPATRYAGMGDTQLLGLFSTDRWGKLSYAEKLDACQEVENRYAAANGCEPCAVRAEHMTGAAYGYQSNASIYLNESLVRDGVFLTEDVDENGATVLVPVEVRASNWQTLETVFHEGTHGLQESRGQMPSTYFDPDSDYDIYRIQPIEKQAFEAGQANTLRAIDAVQTADGKLDQNAADYLASVKASSYRECLEAAARNYGDENIDATVAAVIQHRDRGLTMQDPSESYKALNELLDEQDRRLEEFKQNEAQQGQEGRQKQDEQNRQEQNGRQEPDDRQDSGDRREQSDRQDQRGRGDEQEGASQGRASSQTEERESDAVRDAYDVEPDDGLDSALGARSAASSPDAGAYANEAASFASGGNAYDADDGLDAASPGMDGPSSASDAGASADASNDNDDAGASQGDDGGNDRDGGQDM